MTGKAAYDEAMAFYDSAREAVLAAHSRLERAQGVLEAAERTQETAEAELSKHEAYPGIPAYAHAQVTAQDCGLQPQCKVHPS